MTEVLKIKNDNPVIKYLRSLQYKDYVTDLKYTHFEDLSFAVINKNGIKQDTIKICINEEIYYNEELYKYSIYKGENKIVEDKEGLEIVALLKNYLIKFQKSIYNQFLTDKENERRINLYTYAEKICNQVNIKFNIPIESLESDLDAISFVVSDTYGVKSIVISDKFLKSHDMDFVLNTFKLQLLRFIAHEKKKPFNNSKPYFKNLIEKYSLMDYKNYAKVRRVS